MWGPGLQPRLSPTLAGQRPKEKLMQRERDKRISRIETILRKLCDQSKRNNICIIGVPKEEEREKGIESVFEEINAENFPKLGEDIGAQTTEAHRTPERQDPKRTTPRHIIIKMAKIKDKDRVLKAARERKRSPTKETQQAIIRLLNRNLTGQKRIA